MRTLTALMITLARSIARPIAVSVKTKRRVRSFLTIFWQEVISDDEAESLSISQLDIEEY